MFILFHITDIAPKPNKSISTGIVDWVRKVEEGKNVENVVDVDVRVRVNGDESSSRLVMEYIKKSRNNIKKEIERILLKTPEGVELEE